MMAVPLLVLNLLVANVDCDQWERIDDTHWRSESGAAIVLDNGGKIRLSRIDLTDTSAPDLFWTLESFCYAASNGGY